MELLTPETRFVYFSTTMSFFAPNPEEHFGSMHADGAPRRSHIKREYSPEGNANRSAASTDSVERLCREFGSSSDDEALTSAIPLSPSVEHFLDDTDGPAPKKPKKGKKKNDPTEPAGEGAPSFTYMSAREMQHFNMVNKYGKDATVNAEIDLDDTSCEELEQEEAQRQLRIDTLRRRRMTHEVRTRRQERFHERRAGIASASVDLEGSACLHRNSSRTDCSDSDPDYDRPDFYERPLVDSDSECSPVDSSSRPTRKRKRIQLASTATARGKITRCFLCGWGRDDYTLVDNDHIKELFRILFSKPGTDMRIIAREAHLFYKNQIRRDAILRGQELPIWRSRDILICLMEHRRNPKIRLQIDLAQVQQKRDALDSMCFIKDSTGKVHPHLKNMREWRDLTNLYYKIMEKDMTRMNYYQPELNINLADSEFKVSAVRLLQHRATVNKVTR